MTAEEVFERIKNIQTYMPDSDRRILFEYASQVPENGVIVDIGTAGGNSALVMALAAPTSQVWTIDPTNNEEFLASLVTLGLENRVFFYNETSNEAIKNWPSRPIDLLFVDGLHTHQGVSDDLMNWGKYVKPGSYILIHDYLLYRDTIGKAVDDAIEAGIVEMVKLTEDDFVNPNGPHSGRAVGMCITKKL